MALADGVEGDVEIHRPRRPVEHGVGAGGAELQHRRAVDLRRQHHDANALHHPGPPNGDLRRRVRARPEHEELARPELGERLGRRRCEHTAHDAERLGERTNALADEAPFVGHHCRQHAAAFVVAIVGGNDRR